MRAISSADSVGEDLFGEERGTRAWTKVLFGDRGCGLVLELVAVLNPTTQFFVFDDTQRHDNVSFYYGDIREKVQVLDALKKSNATCIVHAKSPIPIRNQGNPGIFHQVNVDGTQNVIEAAIEAGVHKLVYHSSSGVVFGGHDIWDADESPT
ncbi:hypothetical protein D9757_011547 [Collybiopsis confluens]|uniref:3-beta hydroxysteroid dehydrogenase/isomerase domain-containing protein n=1 Tax=Collybiopsis confluens TaxID=2823264 RepID=A0A8H5GB83_9AGAR|nr:hypothetical protein D9757_011547 [Collybiopsis confluens]